MIDISGLGFQFRGYPVTIATEGAMALLAGGVPSNLGRLLRESHDTAGPDEPSGWIFESDVNGKVVWIGRFGGLRETGRHEGGQWSVYLPED